MINTADTNVPQSGCQNRSFKFKIAPNNGLKLSLKIHFFLDFGILDHSYATTVKMKYVNTIFRTNMSTLIPSAIFH